MDCNFLSNHSLYLSCTNWYPPKNSFYFKQRTSYSSSFFTTLYDYARTQHPSFTCQAHACSKPFFLQHMYIHKLPTHINMFFMMQTLCFQSTLTFTFGNNMPYCHKEGIISHHRCLTFTFKILMLCPLVFLPELPCFQGPGMICQTLSPKLIIWMFYSIFIPSM
mgnify:CR=1 FL=1